MIKKKLVKQGIKIGDYVNYDATSGKGTGLSYTVDTKKTRSKGSGSIEEAETFNSSDITKWRVLSIKNGTIELVAEQPTSNSLELAGSDGYINAETILNEIGDIYGHGNGAVRGRSINVDDIDQYFKFDKESYSQDNFKYGDTKEYTSGRFIVNDEIKEAPQTIKSTHYWYELEDNKFEKSENEAAYLAYEKIFKNIDTKIHRASKAFWLASRDVKMYLDDYYCRFRCAHCFEWSFNGEG